MDCPPLALSSAAIQQAMPALFHTQGTILPGVTRRSIIELAQQRGYTVEETPVSVDEAMEADELFTTGTAVVVCAVGSLTYRGERKQFGTPGEPGMDGGYWGGERNAATW